MEVENIICWIMKLARVVPLKIYLFVGHTGVIVVTKRRSRKVINSFFGMRNATVHKKCSCLHSNNLRSRVATYE